MEGYITPTVCLKVAASGRKWPQVAAHMWQAFVPTCSRLRPVSLRGQHIAWSESVSKAPTSLSIRKLRVTAKVHDRRLVKHPQARADLRYFIAKKSQGTRKPEMRWCCASRNSSLCRLTTHKPEATLVPKCYMYDYLAHRRVRRMPVLQ